MYRNNIKKCSQILKNRCLNYNIPTMMAYANDISYDDVFMKPLKNFMKIEDCVIGISSSENSKNIIKL